MGSGLDATLGLEALLTGGGVFLTTGDVLFNVANGAFCSNVGVDDKEEIDPLEVFDEDLPGSLLLGPFALFLFAWVIFAGPVMSGKVVDL